MKLIQSVNQIKHKTLTCGGRESPPTPCTLGVSSSDNCLRSQRMKLCRYIRQIDYNLLDNRLAYLKSPTYANFRSPKGHLHQISLLNSKLDECRRILTEPCSDDPLLQYDELNQAYGQLRQIYQEYKREENQNKVILRSELGKIKALYPIYCLTRLLQRTQELLMQIGRPSDSLMEALNNLSEQPGYVGILYTKFQSELSHYCQKFRQPILDDLMIIDLLLSKCDRRRPEKCVQFIQDISVQPFSTNLRETRSVTPLLEDVLRHRASPFGPFGPFSPLIDTLEKLRHTLKRQLRPLDDLNDLLRLFNHGQTNIIAKCAITEADFIHEVQRHFELIPVDYPQELFDHFDQYQRDLERLRVIRKELEQHLIQMNNSEFFRVTKEIQTINSAIAHLESEKLRLPGTELAFNVQIDLQRKKLSKLQQILQPIHQGRNLISEIDGLLKYKNYDEFIRGYRQIIPKIKEFLGRKN